MILIGIKYSITIVKTVQGQVRILFENILYKAIFTGWLRWAISYAKHYGVYTVFPFIWDIIDM